MKSLEEFLQENKKYYELKTIGLSESGKPINALYLKKGKGLRKKALLLSYLHGDEPETLQANLTTLENILQYGLLCSWEIMSILVANPDGKQLKTRYNLNGIDLNRDFILKKAKETKTITKFYENFKPEIVLDYHSNLSNKFSCIIISENTDIKICQDIILSYQEIREQMNLAAHQSVIDTRNNVIADIYSRGIYILSGCNKGLFVEYTGHKSKTAVAIEDYGIELSIEFSTELLKKL